jgi:hypothetical protein
MRTAHHCLLLSPEFGEAGSSEGGIFPAGKGWDSPQVGQPMVIEAPHGEDDRWVLGALQRLLLA